VTLKFALDWVAQSDRVPVIDEGLFLELALLMANQTTHHHYQNDFLENRLMGHQTTLLPHH
jgi:hypothetical protein